MLHTESAGQEAPAGATVVHVVVDRTNSLIALEAPFPLGKSHLVLETEPDAVARTQAPAEKRLVLLVKVFSLRVHSQPQAATAGHIPCGYLRFHPFPQNTRITTSYVPETGITERALGFHLTSFEAQDPLRRLCSVRTR